MLHLRTKFVSIVGLTSNSDAALSNWMKLSNNILCLNTHYSTSPSMDETMRNHNKPDDKSVPYSEREGRWQSVFAAFLNKQSSPPDISRLKPQNFSVVGFRRWMKKKQREKMCFEQRYLIERHQALGNELGAAHFIVFRGGAVKFVGNSDWIKDDKSKNKDYDECLPNHFDPSFYVEAIDFCDFPVVYEGLENIKGLLKLKWLSFHGSPYFDDWYLDRITADYHNKLEYLDISNTKVTHRGLCSMYKCSKLKILKVNGISDSKVFQLTCLMLEDLLPDLKIEGVTYMSIDESE